MSDHTQHPIWTNQPTHLKKDEIQNPFELIKDLYEEIDMVDCRKYLKIWFRSAINNRSLLSKDQIITLVWFKSCLTRLIEAGFIIYNDYFEEHYGVIPDAAGDKAIMKRKYYCSAQLKYQTEWEYFPRYLSRKEFKNPYKVLKKIYSARSLPEWRDMINSLFSDALIDSNATCDTDDDIWQTFEYLLKFVEAAHLIIVRMPDEGNQ